jgi:hypothetical protein
MKVPGKKGKEGRIIAQSQLDVNQENIEGAVRVNSSTGNRMVLSRRISDLAQGMRINILIGTFHGSGYGKTPMARENFRGPHA